MAGLKKSDFGNLTSWFMDHFANTMLKLGYEHKLIMRATDFVGELCFDAHCNRSVQGTLNIARTCDLEGQLWRVGDVMDLLPYSTSAILCARPVRIKGMRTTECLFPDREMKRFLSTL
jgi:hypothetical protein